MGCCCSSEDDRNDSDSDRQRLLNGSNSHPQPIESSANDYPRTSSLLKKNDEQTALNRILHIAASNVIDVAALDSHGMEQQELVEKAKQYNQRMGTVDIVVKGRLRKKDALPDGAVSLDKVSTIPLLAAADVELVKNFSRNAEEAYHSFAVVHDEDLIVQFAMT